MKFLVVDDSPTTRKIVITFLRALEYTKIVEACDGIDALDKLKAEHFDIIITDWNMPRLNGVELASILSHDDNFKHIPIMLITTRGEKEDVIKAFNFKISAYITKPFTATIFEEKLNIILNKLKKLHGTDEVINSISINQIIDTANLDDFASIKYTVGFKKGTIPQSSQLITLNKKSSKKQGFVLVTHHVFKEDKVDVKMALYDDDQNLIDSFNFNSK